MPAVFHLRIYGGFEQCAQGHEAVDNRDDNVACRLVCFQGRVDNICMSLGGRVAEELVIRDITTGASADLQHVSEIARRMVTQWGMSDKLGLVAYDSDQPVFMGMEYGHSGRTCSPETAAIIDQEVRRIITEAHERARTLLKENRSVLDNMARVLVERETIYNEEVMMLVKGADYKEVLEYMDQNDGKTIDRMSANAINPAKEAAAKAEAEAEVETVATEETVETTEKENSDNE